MLDPELAAIAALAAQIATTATMGFLAYQIILQRRETRRVSYQRLMEEFSNLSKFALEHPDLEKHIPTYVSETKEKREAFWYLDMLISLLERVWIADLEGQLSRNSWPLWRNWIEELATNKIFVDHFQQNTKYYESTFVAEINRIIQEVHKKLAQTQQVNAQNSETKG